MDLKNLKFHIKNIDDFGTLATILSLHKQTKKPPTDEIIEELMFLQEYHKITK